MVQLTVINSALDRMNEALTFDAKIGQFIVSLKSNIGRSGNKIADYFGTIIGIIVGIYLPLPVDFWPLNPIDDAIVFVVGFVLMLLAKQIVIGIDRS